MISGQRPSARSTKASISRVRRGRPSSDAATPPTITTGIPATVRLRWSASRAATSEAGSTSVTVCGPDPVPAIGQRYAFREGVRIRWKHDTRGKQGLELSPLLRDAHGLELGELLRSDGLPASQVVLGLKRGDSRHVAMISRVGTEGAGGPTATGRRCRRRQHPAACTAASVEWPRCGRRVATRVLQAGPAAPCPLARSRARTGPGLSIMEHRR